jgi:hypothetical protein
LRAADRRPLTVLGAIPVVITVSGIESNTITQFLHIVSELSALFISKTCLKELNIFSESLPIPHKPPKDPFHVTDADIIKLKELLISHYTTSTMNMCAHQPLDSMFAPPQILY